MRSLVHLTVTKIYYSLPALAVLTNDSLGLTITVPHGASMAMSELSFIAALHSAKEIAKRENISTVYACK